MESTRFWVNYNISTLFPWCFSDMSHFCADPGHLELRLGRADLVGRLQAVPEPAPRGAEG